MQDNLSNRIYNANGYRKGEPYLTDSEQASLLDIVSKRCKSTTKEKLARYISRPLVYWIDSGIFKRVTFKDGKVTYVCGQSWTDEMRTLRECITLSYVPF